MSQDSPKREDSPSRDLNLAKTAAATEVAEQATLHARPDAGGERSGQRQQGTDWVGREVQGRYQIQDVLGEGGMGVVYVAEHIHLKKKVAFKVIHPELAANEELLARFTREALATGQLDHPHICAAIDYDRMQDGSAYLVMPFVRGHSLQAELEGEPEGMDWRQVARYGAQIADALSAAHALGIVHRDLKPDNVLVETRPDGSRAAKVLDFGVASLTGASQSLSSDTKKPLTQAGMILGTPGYMSPEQATAGEVDHRTDLYALGVILWELTAGKRLFDGPDVTRIFAKQFNSVPEPLGLAQVGPAREFGELVMQLLRPQKDERPEATAEVRDTLRRLSEAPEPTAVETALVTGRERALERLSAGREQAREKWAQLPQRTQAAVAAAAVVLLGLLGWSFSGEEPPEAKAKGATQQQQGESQQSDKGGSDGSARHEKRAKRNHSDDGASAGEGKREASLVDKVGSLFEGLPDELKQARTTLFEGKRHRERNEAARAILGYEGDVEIPEYLRLCADLELARGCRNRRDVLRKVAELGDSDALPMVQRLDETPRRGCGAFNLRDCYACMRKDIEQALEALQ